MDQRKLDAILLVVLCIGLMTLLVGNNPTGYATASQSIEIESLQLDLLWQDNATLAITATITNTGNLPVSPTISLLVDNKEVNSTKADIEESTEVELSWPVVEGIHKIRVESLGVAAETLVEVTKKPDTTYSVKELAIEDTTVDTHILDFSKDGVEYEVKVGERDVLKLTFEEQTSLITIDGIASFVAIGVVQQPVGGVFTFDLNGDETNDIKITVDSIDEGIASLTIESLYKPSLFDSILSFWWLALIIIVIAIAVFLMSKTELLRTKHGRGVLKRVEQARKDGVISDSLYQKARRAIRKKLKP